MTQQDIAEAKQLLFGIQETDLPAELKEASIKQLALAQQAAAHYIGRLTTSTSRSCTVMS